MQIKEKQILYASRRTRFELFEHFLNFPTASGAVGGAFALAVALASGGLSLAGSDATHPGVVRLSTQITATGRAAVNTNLNAFLLGSGTYEVEMSFRLSTALSTGTESYSIWLGFSDSTSGVPANGAGLFYSANNANWLYACRRAGVETAVLSGSIADTSWHTLNIKLNKAATIATFTLDSNAPIEINTNIPNTNRIGLQAYILKSVGTTARTIDLDYISLKTDFT